MSNDNIYGGPLRAEITKNPYQQRVDVTGDDVSVSASSNNLVKSISMALNEVYRPEVTMDDHFSAVDEFLLHRHNELVEKRNEVENVIESYDEHTWLPEAPEAYHLVLEAIDDYLEDLEVTMDTLSDEMEHNAKRND